MGTGVEQVRLGLEQCECVWGGFTCGYKINQSNFLQIFTDKSGVKNVYRVGRVVYGLRTGRAAGCTGTFHERK